MIPIVFGVLLGPMILVPVAVKWNIQMKIALPAGVLAGVVSGAVVSMLKPIQADGLLVSAAAEVLLILLISTSLLLWRFYRDPERNPPGSDFSILSPADGKVVYVKTVENGMLAECEKNGKKYPLRDFVGSDLLQQAGTLIGISMSILDVHVNRSPISGTIVALHLIEGRFASLRKAQAEFLNQRQITIVEEGPVRIAVVQIASRLVRNIVSFRKVGDEVRRGERIGVIRFGSQVDLYLPNDRETRIGVITGQQVKAGVTVVADVQ